MNVLVATIIAVVLSAIFMLIKGVVMGRKKTAVLKWSSDGCYVSVIDREGNELERSDTSDKAREWCEDNEYKVVKES